MIAKCPLEAHGPPPTKEGGIPQRQRMRMTGNFLFDLLYHPLMLRIILALLPSPVMITSEGVPMCGITVVGALSITIRGSQMALLDLKDSEVSIEWTWIGTMSECLAMYTHGTLLAYPRDRTPVIANEGFGIVRDGRSQGVIPIMTILDIDRVVSLPTPMAMVGTRSMTTDLRDGTTKIISGVQTDLGQTGTGDLSSVTLLLFLLRQTPGRLGKNVRQGNSGNAMRGEGPHTPHPLLAQIVRMTQEDLPRFHRRGILPLPPKAVILLGGIWIHQQSILSRPFQSLLARVLLCRVMHLGIHRGSDPGARVQFLSLGIRRGRRSRGREKTLFLVLRVNTIHPTLLGKETRAAPLGVEPTILHHYLQGCLLDPLAIMDTPLAWVSTGAQGITTKDPETAIHQGHHPPPRDTTVCRPLEDTARITIREEATHEMIDGITGLPRGVDQGFGLQTRLPRIPIEPDIPKTPINLDLNIPPI